MSPSNEHQPAKDDVRQTTRSAQDPSRRPEEKGSRSRIRESVRTMGYEEGAKALSTQPDDQKEARLRNYEEALGDFLGGHLFELVSENVSPDEVMGYASDAVDQLVEMVGDAYRDVNPGEKGDEDAKALEEEWGRVLEQYVMRYGKSESGRKVSARVGEYLETHPRTVLTAILLAAASAVAANVRLPAIRKKVQITDGLQAHVEAKLGRIRDITLETIKARLEYEEGKFKAKLTGEHDAKTETTRGTVEVSQGDDHSRATASAEAVVDEKGLLSTSAAIGGHRGKLKGSVGYTEHRDKGESMDAQVSYGDKTRRISGGARYDAANGGLKLQLSDEIHKDLLTYRRSLEYDESKGDFTTRTSQRHGTERNFLQASTEQSRDVSKVGIAAGFGKGALDLSGSHTEDTSGMSESRLGAKYSTRDLTVALDASFGAQGDHLSASANRRREDGLTYGADVKFSLDDSRVLGYGARFGFRDPEEFKGFLLEYRHDATPDLPEDQFKATVEHTVDQLMLRGTGKTTLRDGRFSLGELGVHAAYPLNDDMKVIGGVTQGFGPDRDVGTRPEVGLQVGRIPVMVGYDTNSKAWSLRLTIPFGR